MSRTENLQWNFSWLFSGAKNTEATTKFGGKSVLPPIRGSVFPEIRACMEEQDFHINIIKGKKKVSPVMQGRRGNVFQVPITSTDILVLSFANACVI